MVKTKKKISLDVFTERIGRNDYSVNVYYPKIEFTSKTDTSCGNENVVHCKEYVFQLPSQ